MIKFDKPDVLNGTQLVEELKKVGINVNTDTSPKIDGNGDFWLDIAQKDKAKAQGIVADHVGIDQSDNRAAQRQAILDKLGLTADEARLLLG